MLLLVPALAFAVGYILSAKTEDMAMYQRLALLVRFYLVNPEKRAKEEFRMGKRPEKRFLSAPKRTVPSIDKQLTRLVDNVVGEFVTKWFDSLNLSRDSTFEVHIHNSLKHALILLINQLENADISNLFVRIFQAVIIHLREYREYEHLAIPLDRYLEENTPFSVLSTESQSLRFLHELSLRISKRLLPKYERSPIALSFVAEILGSSIIFPIVQRISDPDWINQLIVTLSIDSEDAAVVTPGISSPLLPILPLVSKASESKEATSRQFYVKLVEARQLPVKSISGMIYGQVICGTDVRKTKKHEVDSNPLFSSDFTLYVFVH